MWGIAAPPVCVRAGDGLGRFSCRRRCVSPRRRQRIAIERNCDSTRSSSFYLDAGETVAVVAVEELGQPLQTVVGRVARLTHDQFVVVGHGIVGCHRAQLTSVATCRRRSRRPRNACQPVNKAPRPTSRRPRRGLALRRQRHLTLKE